MALRLRSLEVENPSCGQHPAVLHIKSPAIATNVRHLALVSASALPRILLIASLIFPFAQRFASEFVS